MQGLRFVDHSPEHCSGVHPINMEWQEFNRRTHFFIGGITMNEFLSWVGQNWIDIFAILWLTVITCYLIKKKYELERQSKDDQKN